MILLFDSKKFLNALHSALWSVLGFNTRPQHTHTPTLTHPITKSADIPAVLIHSWEECESKKQKQ